MNFGHRNDRFRRTFSTLVNVDRINRFQEEQRNLIPPVPRTYFRDQQNPLETYSDELFQRNFAFTKTTFRNVFDIFKDDLAAPHINNSEPHLPPLLRMTVFMQYLRSNSFYRCVSTQRVVDLPPSSVCRVVNAVAKVIANRSDEYIKIPTLDEQNQTADRIFKEFKIPGK